MIWKGPNEYFAELTQHGVQKKINPVTIWGIPSEATRTWKLFSAFLSHCYGLTNTLSDGEISLRVSHQLLGGTPPHDKLINKTKKAIHEASKAKGLDIVALVGNTHTGKSTLVNALFGKRMKITGEGLFRQVDVWDGQEIAPIGHKATRSETKFAKVYVQEGSSYNFVDCGGFLDTRRDEGYCFAVPLSIMYTLQNAASVKMMICCEYATLAATRGQHLAELLSTVLGRLVEPDHLDELAKSLIFVITKAPRDATARETYLLLDKMISEFKETEEKTGLPSQLRGYYELITAQGGNNILIADPMDRDSMDQILNRLGEVGQVKEPKGKFRPAYAKDAERDLLKEMVGIAYKATTALSAYLQNNQQIQVYTGHREEVLRKINREHEIIRQISSTELDPTEALKQIIGHKNEEVRSLTTSIEEKERTILADQALIERIEDERNIHRSRGEELEMYRNYVISLQPRFITHTTTYYEAEYGHGVKKLWNKYGWGEPEYKKKTSETREGVPSEQQISFAGVRIEHVEFDPPYVKDASPWKNMDEADLPLSGRSSLSFQFVSPPGQEGHGIMKIFVKKKDTAEFVHSDRAFADQLNSV
jgi:hypothetical protein